MEVAKININWSLVSKLHNVPSSTNQFESKLFAYEA